MNPPCRPCEVRLGGEWTDAWLIAKSGRYAYVRLSTRGPELRIPVTHVRTEATKEAS